jgi:hypothetical protein
MLCQFSHHDHVICRCFNCCTGTLMYTFLIIFDINIIYFYISFFNFFQWHRSSRFFFVVFFYLFNVFSSFIKIIQYQLPCCTHCVRALWMAWREKLNKNRRYFLMSMLSHIVTNNEQTNKQTYKLINVHDF